MGLLEILRLGIEPALALLPPRMDSKEARVMLLAIGLQESRFEHRRQISGPARGFWQFEQGGGVRGVLMHPASRGQAQALCRARGIEPIERDIYGAIDLDDVLAAGIARLLLWTDSHALPAVGDAASAWDYYLRTWRPGKPHPQTWPGLYAKALETVS